MAASEDGRFACATFSSSSSAPFSADVKFTGDGEFAEEKEGGACLERLWQQYPWQKMRVHCPGRYFIPNRLASHLTPDDVIHSLHLPEEILCHCVWVRHVSGGSPAVAMEEKPEGVSDQDRDRQEDDDGKKSKKKDDITVVFFPDRGGLMSYKKLSPPPRPKRPPPPKKRSRNQQTQLSLEQAPPQPIEPPTTPQPLETIYIHTFNTHSGLKRKLLALGLQGIWEQGPQPD